MTFQKFDLFSSQFFFNLGGQQIKKGTLSGFLLSFFISATTITYLAYLLTQYFNNQIEPSYRSQNFTNTNFIDIEFTNDLISFRYESGFNIGVDVLQNEQNKTYIVYLAYLAYMDKDNYQRVPINIIKCTNPGLDGFYCLDYSNFSNYTLSSDDSKNNLAQVQIFAYGCQDIDFQKTTIPDNCASQQDIDNLLNYFSSSLKIQIKTSQHNIKTQKFEQSYKFSQIYSISNQYIITTLKVQKQVTSIKQGLLVQSETIDHSPLSYEIEYQTLNRQSASVLTSTSCFVSSTIMVDQLYQEVSIQYPTLPSMIALANGVFSVLMFLGFFVRKFSLDSIQQTKAFLQFYCKIFTKNLI